MWTVYIISVKEDQARRAHVITLVNKLTTLGFNVEVIDAIYWKTTNVMILLQELNISACNVSQSQVACFLSHRLVWQKITQTITDYNIILEDDMDLLDIDVLNKVLTDMTTINYDGVIMWKHPDFNNITSHVTSTLRESYPQWGLCAYSLKKDLCTDMLNINCLSTPIDNYLYDVLWKQYKMYITVNDPFNNLGFLGGNSLNPYTFKSLIYN
jgi:GR25 family glycosyltransferase involved in LPS biosynthesis